MYIISYLNEVLGACEDFDDAVAFFEGCRSQLQKSEETELSLSVCLPDGTTKQIQRIKAYITEGELKTISNRIISDDKYKTIVEYNSAPNTYAIKDVFV